MSGMFEDFGTEHIEEKARDFVGFQPLDTDLYKGNIKLAYLAIHESKAKGIVFEFDLGGGKTLKIEQIISTKEGKNTFVNSKTKKTAPLAGFTVVDDICTVTTGKGLKGQPTEQKMVKVYNYDKKEDVPTQVHVLTDLIGKEVGLAVVKKVENKQKKVDGVYVATSEKVTRNDIYKVVYPNTGATVNETAEKKDPTWAANWVKNNRGTTKEKLTYKGGDTSTGSGDAPPASDRKPLFG